MQQCQGEFALLLNYAQDAATGPPEQRFHKLGLVSDFPMKRAGGRKSAGADSLIIDNRRSELTFGKLWQLLHQLGRDRAEDAFTAKGQRNSRGATSQARSPLYALPEWSTCVADGGEDPGGVANVLADLPLAWLNLSKNEQALRPSTYKPRSICIPTL